MPICAVMGLALDSVFASRDPLLSRSASYPGPGAMFQDAARTAAPRRTPMSSF
jgi:hypothetical protein